jgi:DNA-binding NarL/FixJ family response regulator
VLSSYHEHEYIEGPLEYGAAGHIAKVEGPQAIVEAVRKVTRGERGLFRQKAKNGMQGNE